MVSALMGVTAGQVGGPAGPQSAHGRLDSAPKDSGGTAAGAPEGLSWTRQAWKVASFEKNRTGEEEL